MILKDNMKTKDNGLGVWFSVQKRITKADQVPLAWVKGFEWMGVNTHFSVEAAVTACDFQRRAHPERDYRVVRREVTEIKWTTSVKIHKSRGSHK